MGSFLSSPYGIVLQTVLAWTVLDALLTGLIAWKVDKFELRSFSLFLEKIGSEAVGIAALGAAAYYGPVTAVIAPLFAASFLIFVGAEGAGVKDKVEELIANLKEAKS